MKRLYILRLKFKYFFKRILIFKKNKRMSKVKIGKTYKVKQTPNGKTGSNGTGTRQGESTEVSVIRSVHNGKGIMYLCKMTKVSDSMRRNGYITGNNYNYYDYELEIGPYNKETILEEIEEVNKKKSELDNEAIRTSVKD